VRAPATVANYPATVRGFNRNVRLLFVYSGLGAFGVFGIASLLANLYLLRLGYGPEFIGLANALMMLGMGVLSLPAGELGRRFTNRLLMIAGAAIMSFAYIALALAWLMPASVRSAWVLVQFLLIGVSFATQNVNYAPFLMGWVSDKESNHAFSVCMAVNTAGGFLGALVGGLLPGLFAQGLGLAPDDPIPYGLGVLVGGLMVVPAVFVFLPTREPQVGGATGGVSDEGQPQPEAGPAREQAPWHTIMLLALLCSCRRWAWARSLSGTCTSTKRCTSLLQRWGRCRPPAGLQAPSQHWPRPCSWPGWVGRAHTYWRY